jgi:hypothetical protein
MLVESLKVLLTADASDLSKGVKKAQEDVEDFGKKVAIAAAAAAAAFAALAVASVKAFAKQEEAQAQLGRVAGKATDEFIRQADAMEKSLGVESEKVNSVQKLLLTFGQAPAQVERTTRAILDYAAATGTDAETATEALQRGVITGTGYIKALGINFETTGNRGKDLALATDALAKKFSGSAAAAAETLSGKLKILASYWDDLLKGFGGFIANVEAKYGVLKKLADVFGTLNSHMARSGRDELLTEQISLMKALEQFRALDVQGKGDYFRQVVQSGGTMSTPDAMAKRIAEIGQELKKYTEAITLETKGTADATETMKAAAVDTASLLSKAFDANAHIVDGWISAEADYAREVKEAAEKIAGAAGESRKRREENRAAGSASLEGSRLSGGNRLGNVSTTSISARARGMTSEQIDEFTKSTQRELQIRERIVTVLASGARSLTSSLGRLGTVINAAVEGFQAGGIWGAIIAVIVSLLSMTKAFERLNQISELMTGAVLKALDEGLGGLVEGLASIFGAINTILVPIFRVIGRIFGILGKSLEPLGPLIALVGMMLAPIFEVLVTVLDVIMDIMEATLIPISRVLFDIGKGLYVGLICIAEFFAMAWNAVVSALADFMSWIPVVGGDMAAELRKMLINTDQLQAYRESVENTTFDDLINTTRTLANAHIEAAGAVKEFGESLTNVPSGFKVAAARFAATAATGGASSMAAAAAGGAGVEVKVYVDSREVAARVAARQSRGKFVATGGIAESPSEGDSLSGGTSGRWGER